MCSCKNHGSYHKTIITILLTLSLYQCMLIASNLVLVVVSHLTNLLKQKNAAITLCCNLNSINSLNWTVFPTIMKHSDHFPHEERQLKQLCYKTTKPMD